MILRITKRENSYAQIDKRCLNDDRLSWRARGILAYLLSKPDDWEVVVKDLVQGGKEGREAVQAALIELKNFGYASIEICRAENGQLSGKRWTIHEEPINGFSVHRPATDRPENRPTVFPTDGKSAPTNNDLTNNDLIEKDISVSSVSATPDPEPEKKKKAPSVSAPPPEVIQVVEYLNQLTGAAYRPGTKTTAGMVNARLSEGFTVQDFETVIAFKCSQWLSDKKMRDYLRPETLFAPSHFESYLNQARLAIQNKRNDQQQPQHGKFTFDPAAAINRAAQLVEELRRERAPSGG